MNDPLRRLLDSRLKRCADRALDQGQLAAEEVAEVDALSKLCSLADSAQARRSHRVQVTVVGLLILALVSVMLFKRAGTTVVELEATADSLRFQATDTARGSSIRVAGFSISGAKIIDAESVLDPDAAAARIDAPPGGGTITVQDVRVGKGGRVSLERESPTALRMDLSRGVVALSIHGKLVIANRTVEVRFPRAITFSADEAPASVSMVFAPDSEAQLFRHVSVDRLSMLEVRDDREVSAIRAGTIFFESLNGQERKVREAEHLELAGVDGKLRTVSFGKDGIQLRFDGKVADLRKGVPPNSASIMPTWLELARAQQPLVLLWSTTATVVGLALGFLRWLKHDL
jgi:hypothetical protein